MNAFDTAWDLMKALYHGTYWGDEVEREGLTEGTKAADFQDYVRDSRMGEDYDWPIEKIKERFLRDYTEEDWERMMVGDTWKYAAGNTKRETPNAPAGRLGALAQALAYGNDVFEIDENHPDAPEWIKEPKWQRSEYDSGELTRYAFPEHSIQWRTKGDVPPQTMRRMSPREVSEIQNQLFNWRQAFADRRSLLEEMMWNIGFLNTLSNPQQAELMRQYKTISGMGQMRATQQEVDDWLRANYLERYASDGGMAIEPV